MGFAPRVLLLLGALGCAPSSAPPEHGTAPDRAAAPVPDAIYHSGPMHRPGDEVLDLNGFAGASEDPRPEAIWFHGQWPRPAISGEDLNASAD